MACTRQRALDAPRRLVSCCSEQVYTGCHQRTLQGPSIPPVNGHDARRALYHLQDILQSPNARSISSKHNRPARRNDNTNSQLLQTLARLFDQNAITPCACMFIYSSKPKYHPDPAQPRRFLSGSARATRHRPIVVEEGVPTHVLQRMVRSAETLVLQDSRQSQSRYCL